MGSDYYLYHKPPRNKEQPNVFAVPFVSCTVLVAVQHNDDDNDVLTLLLAHFPKTQSVVRKDAIVRRDADLIVARPLESHAPK